ncbi:MAG: succinyl-diaminopimelate desuccinylase [Microthrixaceae bacterium]
MSAPPTEGASAAVVDLLELTAELVAVRSESFDEAELVRRIEARLSAAGHLRCERVGDNLVARTELGRPHRVVLGGHTDTVPANDNADARIEGDTLWGVGSSDMKSGLAVMIALAEAHREPPVDLSFVFYAREEVAARHSGLGELTELRPDLLAGDVAVLGEPTDGTLEAGCQGSVRVRVRVVGERAHTARAWMGRNAIHRLGPLLSAIALYEPRQPLIQGCRFHEALQVVSVQGGVAGNVVPDEATLDVAHRFAPDRSAEEATEHLMSIVGPHLADGDEAEVTDVARAAMPALAHPFVSAMVERSNLTVRAKLGWTDVARFAELGVPAVNIGPGDPTLAHTRDERVDRASVEATYATLDAAIRAGF